MSMGTCGGRLHGTCGNVVGDNEMHRICSKRLDNKGKRKKGSPDSEVEGEEDEENEEEDDESTGRGRSAPPYYLNTVNSRLTSASGEGSTRRRSLVPV